MRDERVRWFRGLTRFRGARGSGDGRAQDGCRGQAGEPVFGLCDGAEEANLLSAGIDLAVELVGSAEAVGLAAGCDEGLPCAGSEDRVLCKQADLGGGKG